MTVHLLTGEADAGHGGVGDYTRLLAAAIERRGGKSRIWNARDPRLKEALPEALRTEPGYVLLQYVPNTLGARGANIAFCRWLWSLSRSGTDVRVMFHEPYFYFSWNPLLNVLALTQRAMAAMLLRASSHTYVSTEQWLRYLAPYAPREAVFSILPIPSTLPVHLPESSVAHWRDRLGGGSRVLVGHFGTYGSHVGDELAGVIPVLLRQFERIRFVCIGRGSDAFVSRIHTDQPDNRTRVIATGELAPPDAAAAIAACDVVVQPYPDGVTTRRTSVMAPLALGVATVTSSGFLTEPIWSEGSPVRLAPAGDADAHADAVGTLIRDAGARSELASRGRALYDAQFSIDRTVDALLR